jgi:hypothetical protein
MEGIIYKYPMSANSIYVAGRFTDATTNIYNSSGSISASLTNTSGTSGSFNGLILSYGTSGNYLWSAKYGGAWTSNSSNGYNGYNGVCNDISNNVYVGGQWSLDTTNIYNANGTLFTSLSSSNSNSKGIIVKYNNVGMCQWAIRLDGSSPDTPVFSMYTDFNSNLYVSGRFKGSPMVIYNANGTIAKSITNTNSNTSIATWFLIKYNTNGVFQWVIKYGGPNTPMFRDSDNTLFVDQQSNVYIGGSFYNTILYVYNNNDTNVATISNTGSDVQNGYLIKFDTNGNYLWSTKISSWCHIFSITTDTDKNVYIGGSYANSDLSIYNSSNTLVATLTKTVSTGSTNYASGFVIKYNSSGNYLWSTKLGPPSSHSDDRVYDIITDLSNNVYVVGRISTDIFNIYNISVITNIIITIKSTTI